MSEETPRTNYLTQAWLVLALAACFGAALAGVQSALQPRINQNKLDETYDQIPKLLSPSAGSGAPQAPQVDAAQTQEFVTADGKLAYKAFSSDGRHLGWVIKAVGQGFADKIELLVGLDVKAKTILGMYVLAQKETPAVGNRIEEASWRRRFSGMDATRPVLVTRGSPRPEENEVQAVTGATVSSKSVCEIISKAVAEFREQLSELKPRNRE